MRISFGDVPRRISGSRNFQRLIVVGLTTLSSFSFGNPILKIGVQGSGIEILQNAESGYTYQLQRSLDLFSWTDHGQALQGSNSETFRFDLGNATPKGEFFRILRTTDYGSPEEWIGGSIATNQVDPNQLSGDASNLYTIISSKAFAYLTGTLEQAYHEPVGEIANYFGYAALRNEIRDRGGPLADEGIRGVSWFETLEILNADQRQILYDLMDEHEPYFWGFFDTRLELLDELWVVKSGGDLNVPRAMALGRKMGRDEAELTVLSAKVYADVEKSLSIDQVQAFQDIRSGATSVSDMSVPVANTAEVSAETAGLTNQQRDVLVAIGSKFIPWVTGTVDGAVELPPGKITNYFGFAYYRYVDRANVSRSDAADKLLSVLTDSQRSIIAGLAFDAVRFSNAYIDGRESLIRGYYPLREAQSIDHQALVTAYAETAGVGETQRGIIEALTFSALESQLTIEQKGALLESRIAALE